MEPFLSLPLPAGATHTSFENPTSIPRLPSSRKKANTPTFCQASAHACLISNLPLLLQRTPCSGVSEEGEKAGLGVLDMTTILCNGWSLNRLQRQILCEAMRLDIHSLYGFLHVTDV